MSMPVSLEGKEETATSESTNSQNSKIQHKPFRGYLEEARGPICRVD